MDSSEFDRCAARHEILTEEIGRRPVLAFLEPGGLADCHILTQRETHLGRGPETDVLVLGGKVSRDHCVVLYENVDSPGEPPVCKLVDQDSRNGTFLRGLRLQDPQILRHGDRIMVGDSTLVYMEAAGRSPFSPDDRYEPPTTRDRLTGLKRQDVQYALFEKELERALRYGRPLTLVLVEIENFQLLSFRHGDIASDYLICRLAKILASEVREFDMITRLKSSLFAILLPETAIDGGQILVSRLRTLVAGYRFQVDSTPFDIRLKAGIATCTDGIRTMGDMMSAAGKELVRTDPETCWTSITVA